MKSLAVLLCVAACGSSMIRMTAESRFEMGEEATIMIEAPSADTHSPVEAELVLIRPDGSEHRQDTTLVARHTRVRVGTGPTFTQLGKYRVMLLANDQALASPLDITIKIDRLGELLAETISDWKAKHRFVRARGAAELRWKSYGGVYEHPWDPTREIEVLIEDPGAALKQAWAQYEEHTTLEVMQNNYVRLRERTGSTTASWIAKGLIIQLKAAALQKLDPKFVGRFFARHPSDLQPR